MENPTIPAHKAAKIAAVLWSVLAAYSTIKAMTNINMATGSADKILVVFLFIAARSCRLPTISERAENRRVSLARAD